MGVFDGKDGDFIRNNAAENVRIELLTGNISKRKAYVIAKGAPNNENAQNAALVKAKSMSADELKIFVEILATRFSQEEKTRL
ncbi:MAG TPA: hypothetical protein VMW16_09070 [Sedimentisphaerales bacterium]|nr:hypothetical protein [Sedimentisphaerales bacterium]